MKKLYIIAILVFAAYSCTKSNTEPIVLEGPDPQKIAAVSGGIVQRNSVIEILFTNEQDTTITIPQGKFKLEPSTKGKLSWRDNHTLIFTPEQVLRAGTRYGATVDLLSTLNIAPFVFSFETPLPTVQVTFDSIKIDKDNKAVISGTVETDKNNDIKNIQSIIQSIELGAPSWTEAENGYKFSFKPVERSDSIRSITLSWSGSPVGAKESGSHTLLIPGTERFEVLDIVPDENGALEVVFSSPLKANQDLKGFLSIEGNTNVSYALNSNIVTIYGVQNEGSMDTIASGASLVIQDIQDVDGKMLFEPVNYVIDSKWELPEVRFVGAGSIVPTSQGTTISIETRNLSGVLIEAFQVYGDNMIQFLQVNNMDGKDELNRVGEPVWTKSMDIGWKETDKNRFVRHALDLSELNRKYKGSLFHIRVSFRRRHIKYECTNAHTDFSNLEFPQDDFPAFSGGTESSYWDSVDGKRYNYDWYRYRFDPCHPSFYAVYSDHDITVGKNVLVSDLGLLAKKNRDGTVFVAATNLKTAQSVQDVNISLINYQGRLLNSTKTDSDGSALLPDPGPPSTLFIAAESSIGDAYLKIGDSYSLSSSHFDVSGGSPFSTSRGLIYGERGVWRPGDKIYLTFLLYDPSKSLPPDHPVLFELEDPRGRIADSLSFNSSLDGFYPITVSTLPSDPTGDWTARVKVGGSTYTKTLKVENVIPNRLKIALDFGARKYLENRYTPVSLEVSWLYGAPAPYLQSRIQVSFSDKENSFPAYGDFSFRDPSRTVDSSYKTIFDEAVDYQGKASFYIDLDHESLLPGKVNAHFYTRAFENSGAFSSEQVTIDFSPYDRYIGVKAPKGDAARNMLLTDTDHTAEVIVVDADGKLVTDNVLLRCEVYKLKWRFWFEKGEYENAADFRSAMWQDPIYRTTVTTSGGRASWNFRVNYPDWGRYLIVVRDYADSGHSAASIVYIDWPSWAGRSTDSGAEGQSMLSLSTDKSSYKTEDKVNVSFPSNADARALVVVEKSGQILSSEWVDCKNESTVYQFTASASMIPNVYVHVTLLQPHLQTLNDLPLRLYGITPVMIDDPFTHIVPVISTDSSWEAESKASFEIKEQSGRRMTYTVAVVDEGLLGLTRYSLPDPMETFYAKEASFLKSWDMFGDVAGAYSGKLATLLAIGGSDNITAGNEGKGSRWESVVISLGPFQLGPGEVRRESFDLPPYIGALRIMVLAASPTNAVGNAAFGTAEKSVTVSSDLMVFATVPRTISGGDEALIPVSVFSYREGNRPVTVSLEVEGASIIGQSQNTVVFDKPGELIVNYRIKAPESPGSIIKIKARTEAAGLKTAVQNTELVVRSTALPVTISQTRLIPAAAIWSGVMSPPGIEGTNRAFIELSRMPPLNLEKRIDFLITYPHGCVEQTTSAVFPQLYLDKIQKLDSARTAEIRENIRGGIERLKGFQTADGGFSYWPGESNSHEWGSSYAGHFIIEARRAGYEIPSGMIEKWVKYQRDKAASWTDNAYYGWGYSDSQSSTLEQSYRLYTLALAGSADIGSMNRLRERGTLDTQTQWRLAASYWLAGQRNIARSMVQNLSTYITQYRQLSGTFGSLLRDTAMIVETLGLIGQSNRAQPLIESISDRLSSDEWLSTQETSYALVAVCSVFNMDSATASIEYSLGDKSEKVTFNTPVFRVDVGGIEAGAFNIKNTAQTPVYAQVIFKGIPAEGNEPAISEGLSLNVAYLNMSGTVINPDTLALGTDMEIRVTVRNNLGRAVQEIALVHPMPSSWEILNTRIGSGAVNIDADYQDIKDDRILTYFDLDAREQKVFIFSVNKSYEGVFFRPSIQSYAMYDESIRAVVPGVKP